MAKIGSFKLLYKTIKERKRDMVRVKETQNELALLREEKILISFIDIIIDFFQKTFSKSND